MTILFASNVCALPPSTVAQQNNTTFDLGLDFPENSDIHTIPAYPASGEEPLPVGDVLTEQPATDRLEGYYVPYDETNGWYISNTFREYLLNIRLEQCYKWETEVLPTCENYMLDPKNPKDADDESFWDKPAGKVSLFVLGMLTGYAIHDAAR